ncbi:MULTISPECIES: hypothetical protein [Gemella]|uniref:hypothetical protein n=1 Tax=Gemella TaxID=1378 RepID=UPI00076809F9|nr:MULTISPECIES: hypothetical protein [Gemella]AME09084.1 hypothetical protein AXE85_02370 [Gemella sp. oral taxon 928]AXI26656.1 hypothetical protein CG018_04145 [Gemella sp. ND 6198]
MDFTDFTDFTTGLLVAIAIIVGIILLMAYIINVVFCAILFEVLGVKKGLAFIPIYNTYRLYKEYKGRVWKSNWGIVYVAVTVISFLLYVFLVVIFLEFIPMLITNVTSGMNAEDAILDIISRLFLWLIVIMVLGVVSTVFNIILSVILYWPLMLTTARKVILVLYLIFGVSQIAGIMNITAENNPDLKSTVNLITIAITIIFIVVALYSAGDIRRQVQSGKKILHDKLDYNSLDNIQINEILVSRKRCLVADNNQAQHNNSIQNMEYI